MVSCKKEKTIEQQVICSALRYISPAPSIFGEIMSRSRWAAHKHQTQKCPIPSLGSWNMIQGAREEPCTMSTQWIHYCISKCEELKEAQAGRVHFEPIPHPEWQGCSIDIAPVSYPERGNTTILLIPLYICTVYLNCKFFRASLTQPFSIFLWVAQEGGPRIVGLLGTFKYL